MTGYVIRGGQPGYDRLLLLAREHWADTRALLERAAVAPGLRCIDIGCGGGEVTMAIARLVAPGGSVVGVDTDGRPRSATSATSRSPRSMPPPGMSRAPMTWCIRDSCCST
jgi:2-polyprenyl-3-methyl-5-hydroxy-6-metoxy-1,4-benzoquinol methylase